MNNILSRTIQVFAIGLLTATFMVGCDSLGKKSEAPKKTVDVSKLENSGTLTFSGRSYKLIVGGGWGDGVLTYKGKKYKFKAKTVGAGYAVGVKDVDVKGNVYNLKKPADLAGSYYGIQAAGTAFVGAGAANLQNKKEVVLSLKGTSKGFAVDAAAGVAWLKIKMGN